MFCLFIKVKIQIKFMGISQYKKPVMFMFLGAVVFGVLASQTGLLGKIGALPSKVTDSISNVSA